MGWESLLAKKGDAVTAPWTGGRNLLAAGRHFVIEGRLPPEHGWHTFAVSGGRKARWSGPAEVDAAEYFKDHKLVRGYLVGDRILVDDQGRGPYRYIVDPDMILEQSYSVALVERGLDRFSRIAAAMYDGGPGLVYVRAEFPLGPEPAVLAALLGGETSIADIPNVTPALELAFRVERRQRERVEERRRQLEVQRQREAEEERRREEAAALAERRAVLIRQARDGAGRRALARTDFGAAARAALAVSGAVLLDHRASYTRGEWVVQFRLENRRFECVCDDSLAIIDAGICLNHNDTLFTLESLPSVVLEARRTGVLHVFRHVDDEQEDDNDDD